MNCNYPDQLKNQKKDSSENGSVLLWIFIAIAAFAALGFALSHMNRGGGQGDKRELGQLFATNILQYGAAIQRGIKVMRINGVEDSELCFHSDVWGHSLYDDSGDDNDCGTTGNQVFSSRGGGVSFQKAESDWFASEPSSLPNGDRVWVFSAHYEIEDVGTTSSGSDTEAENADLLISTAPLKTEACEAINRLLGFSDDSAPSVTAGTYNALATDLFNDDAISYSSATGRISALGRERCVNDGGNFNMYYKVILAR